MASIVESVTGKTYGEYVNNTIVKPLGLKETGSEDLTSVTCTCDALMPDLGFEANPVLVKGSGDITTSVLDLLQFDRALFTGDFMADDARGIMLDFDGDYSCGWMKDNASTVLHYGGNYWESSDADNIYHQGRIPGFWSSNIVLHSSGERMYVI